MRGVVKGWPSRYYLDQGGIVGLVEVTKEEYDLALETYPLATMLESGAAPGGHEPGAWPMHSDALAVHPKQIAEVMERNKRHGLSIEYNSDGCPKLMDRGQRRDLMRVEGCHDNHGGYGD